MEKRRPNAAMSAVKKLAVATGFLVALSAFGAVPAAHSAVTPAARSAVTPAVTGSVQVQDRSHDNDSPDNQLYALYQIVNTGTTAVPMSSLTMRYWFTNSTPSDPLVFACDWAQVNCGNVTSQFVTLSSPRTKANTYVQIGFTAGAGSLAPGASSGEIETRVHHANFSLFDGNNSYSFISDPSFVYKATQTVTLYMNGTLIWGTEP